MTRNSGTKHKVETNLTTTEASTSRNTKPTENRHQYTSDGLMMDSKHKRDMVLTGLKDGNSSSLSSPSCTPCLHCNTMINDVANQVQVSCDSCRGSICKDCHWCHEFQANHEIRVCDRCDAFFCKDCDEMDQCDDCGEVVCSGCCSLLSCKFCGGGLCEECAVACGRCGIVLCARDAKFAVECDTCKLSYCLVCLASGQKEACIRCGHRPSKRMEQLVHLRLKSIYKAFQQSSRTGGGPIGESGGGDMTTSAKQLQSTLQLKKAALAAQKKASSKSSNDAHNRGCQKGSGGLDPVVMQAQADAAAASLLKELEEEEAEAQKKQESKKSKKKKKKRKGGGSVEQVADSAKSETLLVVTPPIDTKQESEVEKEGAPVDELPQKRLNRTPAEEEQTTNSSWTIGDKPEASAKAEDVGDAVRLDSNRHDDGKNGALHRIEFKRLEAELLGHVTSRNIAGIETLLEEWKGVPGRAHLRKNAKKALKRFSAEMQEKRQVEAVPKTSYHTSSTSMIQMISSHCKENNPNNHEVVLHMSRSVNVGWVIGKGGQKIRDLMEESGAKVWIDQESMQPDEPRVVYVGGRKASVEMAVEQISALVAEAPRQDNEVEAPSAAVPDSDATPLAPVPLTNATASHSSDWAEHKMTCEARFVPLLIGKRGWTIKHIQDSSGAKVDIDQSFTPRLISIKGPSENVQTAIRMVRDVLSYPQNQLEGAEAGGDPCRNSDIVWRNSDRDGTHSPPPSSLIMTGDVKSIISASSSLSSTPEPSMASSKGRSYQDFHQSQGQQTFPVSHSPSLFGTGRQDENGQTCLAPIVPQGHQATFPRLHNHYADFTTTTAPNMMVGPHVSPGFSVLPQRHHQPSLPPGSDFGQSQASLGMFQPLGTEPQVLASLNQYQQVQHLPATQGVPSLEGIWEQQPRQTERTGADLLKPPTNHGVGMFAPGVPAAPPSDDANLVDSLFGPDGSTSVLENLQGLSLGGSRWVANTESTWTSGSLPNSSGSRLMSQAAPEKSRFSWGT